jgi:membrane fusion protein, heavy metal efflux system
VKQNHRPLLDSVSVCVLLLAILFSTSCGENKLAPTKTEVVLEPGTYEVQHAEMFKLVSVSTRNLPLIVSANGTIAPDVNSTIHITSQASGRVVDLGVRLGDYIHKGQRLLSIYSADLAGAFSDYQKAVADERIAKKALDRASLLYSRGALATKDLEQAQVAEQKAQVDVENAEQHVRVLGGDPAHPSSMIELRAPVSGTVVEQNISGFEGVKSLDNSPSLFTIADLSHVWVVCDVYENDLGQVQVGDTAEIRLNAYPQRTYRGTVANISRVLDPNLRSAKVRIVLLNSDGSLRPGMYAVAIFRSQKLKPELLVPTTAVMRLQDKDWVFRKENPKRFRRVEIQPLRTTGDGWQAFSGGLNAGDEVVSDALDFSTAVAEQGR